jgi:hypothetical protein
MDYKSRIGMGSASQGGGVAPMNNYMQPSTVGGNFGISTNIGANATGPALVLILITVLLVGDYIWTRGQQGGR